MILMFQCLSFSLAGFSDLCFLFIDTYGRIPRFSSDKNDACCQCQTKYLSPNPKYPQKEYEEFISVATEAKSVLTSEDILLIRREAREVELRIRRNKECEMESLRSRRAGSYNEEFENSYRDHVYRHENHLSVNVDHPRSNLSAANLRSRFKEAGCRHNLRRTSSFTLQCISL